MGDVKRYSHVSLENTVFCDVTVYYERNVLIVLQSLMFIGPCIIVIIEE